MDVERTENLVEFVLKRNEQQSAIFRSAAARLSRARHRARHPTEIAAFKCMDGRLNLPVYTRTPPGVIQPFRNIGGQFDLGWPYLQEKVRRWVNYSIGRGRRCLILDTYHFSAGNKAYGCAGWGHDTEAAREAAFRLAEQAERVFGLSPRIIYPIVVGMETDEEGLVLHGKGGRQFAVANVTSPGEFEGLLRDLCPDMDEQMLSDLLPLLQGNWDHVREIRASRRLASSCSARRTRWPRRPAPPSASFRGREPT